MNEIETNSTTVKRGRGRPRKNISNDVLISDVVNKNDSVTKNTSLNDNVNPIVNENINEVINDDSILDDSEETKGERLKNILKETISELQETLFIYDHEQPLLNEIGIPIDTQPTVNAEESKIEEKESIVEVEEAPMQVIEEKREEIFEDKADVENYIANNDETESFTKMNESDYIAKRNSLYRSITKAEVSRKRDLATQIIGVMVFAVATSFSVMYAVSYILKVFK